MAREKLDGIIPEGTGFEMERDSAELVSDVKDHEAPKHGYGSFQKSGGPHTDPK